MRPFFLILIINDGNRKVGGDRGSSKKEMDWVKNSTGPLSTGKSLSEALIFASTNPHYDNRLFIELHVQCGWHVNRKDVTK